MGGRPAAFGVIERVTGNSVLCSVLEVTKSKYGISPNTETPYLRGLLVEVTGLEPTAPTSRKTTNRCSDLMFSIEMHRVARFRANAFKVICCGLVQFTAGVVSWKCPEPLKSERFSDAPLDKSRFICYHISNNSPRPLWQHMHTWGLSVI